MRWYDVGDRTWYPHTDETKTKLIRQEPPQINNTESDLFFFSCLRTLHHTSFLLRGARRATFFFDSAFAHTAVQGEVAAKNPLFLGGYSAAKDGPVVFSGVAHAVDDDNYLVTKVGAGAVLPCFALPCLALPSTMSACG